MTPSTMSRLASIRRIALVLGLASLAVACRAPRVDRSATVPQKSPYEMTSAELVAAGERDTVYVRRVRMFEEIAATIRTDSLARIMTAAMDAPAEEGAKYQAALSCQYKLMMHQYGAVASKLAIIRTEDSLFAVPGSRKRWVAAQDRWPMFGTVPGDDTCDTRGLPRAADSLEYYPVKTVWP